MIFLLECTQLAIRLSNTTTATTGQKTIGSETQFDLLMMGIKTPRNMLKNNLLPIKSLIVASSWSRLYLLLYILICSALFIQVFVTLRVYTEAAV